MYHAISKGKPNSTKEVIKGKIPLQCSWDVGKQKKTKPAHSWLAPPANMHGRSLC